MRISDWSSDVCSSDLDRPKSCVAHPSPQQAAPRQHQPGVLSRNSHALRQILRDPNDQPFHEALAPHRPQPLRLRHQPFEHGSSSHLTVTRSPTRGSSSTKRTRNTRPPHRKRQSSRSEEHTSELQSLMSISYAVFCLKKK